MEVVGAAKTVAEALAMYDELQPGRRRHRPPAPGRHRPRRRPPRPPRATADAGLVVLTMHSGDDQIFAAMEAGASAFVGKDAPSTEVVKAARHAAVSPRSFLCAGLAEAVMRRTSGGVDPALRPRARRAAAARRRPQRRRDRRPAPPVSESTVKSHVAQIYQKLGAANRAQALVTAMRIGLLSSINPDATAR